MKVYYCAITLINLIFLINLYVCEDRLKSVVVIFRHGDRTPIKPYSKDPFRNASLWPVNFGQLTNLGKYQEYKLGKWLRQRYQNFLPDLYSEDDLYVRSTDVDRTLMSAETCLAGLYPPIKNQLWNNNLIWQPIPIHTTPENEDALLAMKKECPKYKAMMRELFKNDYFQNISHINHDLYAFLSRETGDKITTLQKLDYLYTTLTIEKDYNFTLPEWTNKVYPDKLRPWAELSFSTPCYTKELARLKIGPLFNHLINFFNNHTTTYKLLLFSGHDTTIANILKSLDAFKLHCPPFASAILFELYETLNNKYYLNIFYKNGDIVENITLNSCGFNCDLNKFTNLLKFLNINLDQWENECKLNIFYQMFYNNINFFVLLSIFICILLLLTIIYSILKMSEKKNLYTQLPNNDEIA